MKANPHHFAFLAEALPRPKIFARHPRQIQGHLVVARDDAIYYYGVDGRGPCVGFDGPKSLLAVYDDYVALVSPPAKNGSTPKSNTLRRFGGSQAEEIFNTSTFTLLDTDLKFVAHSESLVSENQRRITNP